MMELRLLVLVIHNVEFSYRERVSLNLFEPHIFNLILYNEDGSIVEDYDKLDIHFNTTNVEFKQEKVDEGIQIVAEFLVFENYYLFINDDLIFTFLPLNNAPDLPLCQVDLLNMTFIKERAPNAVRKDKLLSSQPFPVTIQMSDVNQQIVTSFCDKLSFDYPVNVILSDFDYEINKCVVIISIEIEGYKKSLAIQPRYNNILFGQKVQIVLEEGVESIVLCNLISSIVYLMVAFALLTLGIVKAHKILVRR